MADCTVRVDGEVGRIVGDLAHAMGRTKKQVLREAVLVFADLQSKTVARGLEASGRRAASTEGSLDGARVLAEVGGDVQALALRDRVHVLRREIIAVVERCGAADVRLIGDLAEGRDAKIVQLLVTSDLTGPSWRHIEAAADLRRVLGAPVEFTDATGLRLFATDRLAALEQAAVPL